MRLRATLFLLFFGPPAIAKIVLGDARHYDNLIVPVTATDGAAILHQLCFENPPGCAKGSNACTNYAEYPGLSPSATDEKLAPQKKAQTIRWGGLPVGSAKRKIVWDYLVGQSGAEAARLRLAAIDRMGYEISWHERQHQRHGIVFNAAAETILNSPPQDRDAKWSRLMKASDACAESFHQSQEGEGSYSNLVEQCACYGGEACRQPLPEFPRPYNCQF